MRATEFLAEGGNVFDGTSEIDQKFAPNLTSAINKALTGTGINVITVGSAATPTPGKMSGDFDVMADETVVADYFGAKDAKSARKALADYFRSKGFEVAQSGVNVHVKTPLGKQFAQVDVMVIPQAEAVSKYHIHSLPQGSPYKGKNKQLALHFLSKMKGYFWSAWQGLFARTPDGKKGEMISNDINTIAKTLLGPKANAADLGSVESIMKALPKDQAEQLMATLKADPNWAEIKESFGEVPLMEKGLATAELKKRDNFNKFLNKIKNKEEFETVDGKAVRIKPTKELFGQLQQGQVPLKLEVDPAGVIALGKLKKTQEFGGEDSEKRLKKEKKAMGELKAQLDAVRGNAPYIKLMVGNQVVKAADVRNTPGTPKSDFEIVDENGNAVAWISHKDGSPADPKKFGQWAGISKYMSYPDIQNFLQKFRKVYPKGFRKGDTSVAAPITDEQLKMQAVYGSQYGSGKFNVENVTTVLQGPPQIVKVKNAYKLTALKEWPNGTPFSEGDPYNPIIIARYSSDRKDAGFPTTRIVIYPAFGRKIRNM